MIPHTYIILFTHNIYIYIYTVTYIYICIHLCFTFVKPLIHSETPLHPEPFLLAAFTTPSLKFLTAGTQNPIQLYVDSLAVK